MSALESLEFASASEAQAMLTQFQEEAISVTLPVLYALGAVLFFGLTWQLHDPFRGTVACLLLCGAVAAVWALRHWSHRAASWALVIGCAVVDLQVAQASRLGAAVALLVIPTALAALAIGLGGSAASAAACSLFLLVTPYSWLPVDGALRTTVALSLWSTVALIWLAQRPLLTMLHWSWSSYEQSRQLLERSRDTQVRLKETLADLASANLQLTRLNRLNQVLRQAAEDARRAKEQFAANVSHELRTPLNMIIGFSEMVVRAPETYGPTLPAALLADLEVILRNSQHLSALIDDVLDLSQIESGRMALTREWVILGEVLETAVKAVRPLYESKGLYLELAVEPELPPVMCDRARIRAVALNLLSNAGRFTERGGVRVRAWRESASVVVSVADSGPGIAEHDQGKLFQPFQQVDGSIRRRYGGSGLGLAISKSFVELHGGRMWLESVAGHGTTFYFRLPIDPPAPLEAGPTRWINPAWAYEERTHPSLAPAVAVRPRLVLLENGSSLQRLLTRFLDGVEIQPVTSWEEAARELARMPAQALIVNGASVGDTLLRVHGSAPLPNDTPVVVCAVPEMQQAADALGVSDYLVKPLARDMLLGALDRLCLTQGTVLIVDDEPDAVRMVQRMLTSTGRGYRVLRATSGRQALGILRQERPDALLLDLLMPDMDGFKLLEAKGQDPALRDIPTVVISAQDPAGQPIVSHALAVTRGDGLPVPQLLDCIGAITRVLSPVAGQTELREREDPR